MHRPVSPLLHDYKPSTGITDEKTNAGRWFTFGLGLPLAGIALILFFKDTPSEPLPVIAEETTVVERIKPHIKLASLDIIEETGNDVAPKPIAAALPAVFHPPLLPPYPVYDSLKLTIRRGDTLDRLFRKHGGWNTAGNAAAIGFVGHY